MSNLTMMPSLSEDGWVRSSEHIADYMLTHFFLSEKSQTYLYGNEVASLQYIIQNNADSMTNTVLNTRTALLSYFSRYFSNVEAECTFNDIVDNGTGVNINIFLSFTDSEGKSYSLGKIVSVLNSKISKFITANNG